MLGTPIIPCVCYWDGKGFVAGFMRAKGQEKIFMRAVSKRNFNSGKYGTSSSEGLALSLFLGSCGLCVFWPFFGLPFLSPL